MRTLCGWSAQNKDFEGDWTLRGLPSSHYLGHVEARWAAHFLRESGNNWGCIQSLLI